MRYSLFLFVISILALPLFAIADNPPAANSQENTAGKLTLSASIRLALDNNRQILQGKQMVLGADAKIDEVPLEVEERVSGLLKGKRSACTHHHRAAEQQQRHTHDETLIVKPQSIS